MNTFIICRLIYINKYIMCKMFITDKIKLTIKDIQSTYNLQLSIKIFRYSWIQLPRAVLTLRNNPNQLEWYRVSHRQTRYLSDDYHNSHQQGSMTGLLSWGHDPMKRGHNCRVSLTAELPLRVTNHFLLFIRLDSWYEEFFFFKEECIIEVDFNWWLISFNYLWQYSFWRHIFVYLNIKITFWTF